MLSSSEGRPWADYDLSAETDDAQTVRGLVTRIERICRIVAQLQQNAAALAAAAQKIADLETAASRARARTIYRCGHAHDNRDDALACWNAQGRPLP